MTATGDEWDARPAPPGPPAWSAAEQAWHVSRHAEVQALLRDRRLVATSPVGNLLRIVERTGRSYPDLQALLDATPLFMTGEPHRQARAVIRGFTNALSARWPREAVASLVGSLLDEWPARGAVDALPTLAEALSNAIIGGALGLLPARAQWAHDAGREISAGMWRLWPPPREYARLDGLAAAMRAELDAMRPLSPGDADAQMGDLAAFLASAVSHTMVAGVAAAVALAARRADLQQAMRAEPSLVPAFVQETLRLAGPVKRAARRLTAAAIPLGDMMVAPDTAIVIDFDRAHRDPDVFAEPDRLDLGRPAWPLFAFGAGAHACQGPGLGLLAVEVALRAVLERFVLAPGAAPVLLHPSPDLRQFRSVPLLVVAR